MVDWDAIQHEVVGPEGFAVRLREQVLSPKRLAEEAQKEVLGSPPQLVTCENLNDVLCRLLDREYEIYLRLEKEAFERVIEYALLYEKEYPEISKAVRDALQTIEGGGEASETLKRVAVDILPLYKAVSESFAQSRRSRAGSSAQYHVEFILDQLGFASKYEKQCKLNGTVDFLFPNRDMWEKDRRKCTILSIKRSLRERYKQVYEELNITRGLTVYLMVTETPEEAEKDITEAKIDSLNTQNIYLVVRDEIKKNRFSGKPNVRGFTEFFCNELYKMKDRW